jgi:hypothetical protein
MPEHNPTSAKARAQQERRAAGKRPGKSQGERTSLVEA